jgi:hypothetical protein
VGSAAGIKKITMWLLQFDPACQFHRSQETTINYLVTFNLENRRQMLRPRMKKETVS